MANEKRVRSGFKSGTVDNNPLGIAGTTIDFGSDPGFDTLASDEHIAIILDPEGAAGDPEVVYLTAYTATGTTGTIARAQEGTTAREHAQGTVWRHGPTKRDFAPVSFRTARRTSNATVSGTSWMSPATDLDLTLPAQEGDVIEVAMNALVGSDTESIFADAVSWVSGAPVRSWATDGAVDASGFGVAGWYAGFSTTTAQAGSIRRAVEAAEIVDGEITIRLRARLHTAGSHDILGSSGRPIVFMATNLGPEPA